MRIHLFLTGLFIVVFNSSFCPLHPLKISSSEIACTDRGLLIKIKLFEDDFGVALSQVCKKQIVFDSASVDSLTLVAVKQYVDSNFQISINKKKVDILFVRSIVDENADALTKVVWLYYEVNRIYCHQIKTMAVKNTLLFNVIPEQKNISTIKLLKNEIVKTVLFENQKGDSIKELVF